MKLPFYKKVLKDEFSIELTSPPGPQREVVNRIIYDELVHGIIRDESREQYLKIIEDMVLEGAATILGVPRFLVGSTKPLRHSFSG